MLCDTSALAVIGLRQELADLVRGDGEGDAGRHLQRVDANHLAVLEEEMSTSWLEMATHFSICGMVSPQRKNELRMAHQINQRPS